MKVEKERVMEGRVEKRTQENGRERSTWGKTDPKWCDVALLYLGLRWPPKWEGRMPIPDGVD